MTAYTLFYWSYIPRIGFERQIHLQFDSATLARESTDTTTTQRVAHPYGIVSLAPDVVSLQQYDISIMLNLPRTPTNTAIGNFMLDCRLYGTGADSRSGSDVSLETAPLIAHARRPAILTYLSREVEMVQKLVQMHWFMLGWRREEERLTVPMFETIEFARGRRNLPTTFRLELQLPRESERLQVYDARVIFRARFKGLRWLMYNHRIISAATFITCFWISEIVAMLVAWGVLSYVVFGSSGGGTSSTEMTTPKQTLDIKQETDEDTKLSDTERVFPTYGSQQPMIYPSQRIKSEPGELDTEISPGLDSLSTLPTALTTAAEADDEDEDADFLLDDADKWRDSGIGTSMESSGPSSLKNASLRRRRSRN